MIYSKPEDCTTSVIISDSSVTCGLYINIILGDYLRTIVAMNRTNDSWVLDPRAKGPDIYSHQGAPFGVGNQVSCEFNLIYRWHATLSLVDEKWVGSFMEKLFPGKDMGKISMDEFKFGLYNWAKTIDPDPGKRSVGGLQRNAKGEFDDSALVEILTASTEDCAGRHLLIIAHSSRIRFRDPSCVARCDHAGDGTIPVLEYCFLERISSFLRTRAARDL